MLASLKNTLKTTDWGRMENLNQMAVLLKADVQELRHRIQASADKNACAEAIVNSYLRQD